MGGSQSCGDDCEQTTFILDIKVPLFFFFLSHLLALCLKMQQQRDMEIITVKILAYPWAEITAEHRGQAVSQVLLNFISLIPQKSPLRSSWCYRRVGGLRERWELQGMELSAGSVSHLAPLLASPLACGAALPTWQCHPSLGSLLWNRSIFLKWTMNYL